MNIKNTNNRIKRIRWSNPLILFVLLLILTGVLFLNIASAATPEGPASINVTSNTTKPTTAAQMINISGGYIATLNITANVRDIRWKAFVGWVSGKFTLEDSTSSTIYDWTLSTINGRVYATRNSSTLSWANMRCANTTNLEAENVLMNHTNVDDNITRTFNDVNHTAFYAGSVYFSQNQCNKTINTYVNNATQSGTSYFEEVALTDTASIVYAALLEPHRVGYNGQTYDFQMVVPENGAATFSGATAYYLYIEIS